MRHGTIVYDHHPSPAASKGSMTYTFTHIGNFLLLLLLLPFLLLLLPLRPPPSNPSLEAQIPVLRGLERADLGSERVEGRTEQEQKNGQMNEQKSPSVLWDFVLFGAAA